MSTYVTTGEKVNGAAWAKRYPEKAGELWVVAQSGGKKRKRRIGPPTPENQRAAEKKVREWEYLAERRALVESGIVAESFGEIADHWLSHGLRSRSRGTVECHTYRASVLKQHFGGVPIDGIGAAEIVRWWDEEIPGKREISTGKNYLSSLSMVFRHAAKSQPIDNPVPAAREAIFGDIERTAEYRAANERNCNPLTTDELAKLLPAIEAGGNPDLLATILICYEAGLRIGEAIGLQWGDLWWGRDESDTSRHLHVQRSRANGREGRTKSGRKRKVGMSRRLRRHLQARYMELGRPGDEEWVIEQQWTRAVRARLHRCCKVAKVRPAKLKDLRDTYGSTLITNGIVLKWISLQLGHKSVSVTERHYASYMAMDGYRNPWMVPDGGLPSDLFESLDEWASRKRAVAGRTGEKQT